jgi:site-specific recombinase XerD
MVSAAIGLRPHMLRQASIRARLQDYLGHRNIQHTVRYTKLSESKFKNLWPD